MGQNPIRRRGEWGVVPSGAHRARGAHRHVPLPTPHSPRSLERMPVQAIAWTRSGAVRIVDQRALPEAHIERDLESVAAMVEAIRTLQVRGAPLIGIAAAMGRSEEHTSELQSQSNLVCRLLLEKKKTMLIHP